MSTRGSRIALRTLALAAATITAATVPAANANAAVAGFGLFQDSNYGGCAFYWNNGSVNIPNFKGMHYNTTGCTSRGLNDDISSVSNNCKMYLYTDKNYGGHSEYVPAGEYPTHLKYNDQYSSLKFIC